MSLSLSLFSILFFMPWWALMSANPQHISKIALCERAMSEHSMIIPRGSFLKEMIETLSS